ncbi:MAG: hypothetical protein AAGK47_01885 [Bacteroidota bacterium]
MVKRGFSLYAKTSQDLERVVQTTRSYARSLGFTPTDAEQIATALLEVGTYQLRTAPRIFVQAGDTDRGRTLKILVDNEQGMNKGLWQAIRDEQLELHLAELGISHTPRYMDRFHILAPTSRGATFILKKYLPISKNIFSFHAMTSTAPDVPVHLDDNVLVKEYEGDKVLVALIDSQERYHTPPILSTLVKDYLRTHPDLPLLQLATDCHYIIREHPVEGGLALSLLRLTPGKIFYLGIGDTHTYVRQPYFRKLTPYNGKIGEYDLPIMEVTPLPSQQASRFVLCTNGIKEQIKAPDLVMDLSTQQVSQNVMRRYKRINSQAIVLAVDYRPFE